MKQVTKMLTIVWILALGAGCATLSQNEAGSAWEDRIITADAELVVHGLSCPLCASNLDQQLLRVEGVNDMWVDLQTGHVKIEVEPGATVAASDLARAVRNAGFTLRDILPQEPAP